MSSRSSNRPVSTSRQLARNLRLARLGAKSGGRFAVTKAKQTFASAERKEELNLEFQMRTAEDVTRELGNMKGAMMKIGQMASYLDTGLPDHVRETLASLQHDAPPMTPELAAATLATALGTDPANVFSEWDPVPIAAASIGQVHRAITKDGRAVAVKLQYPGVAGAVASDLNNAGWLFGAMASMFPGLDPEPIVAEIKDRLIEELDYELEAISQEYYADFFDGHPFITVPHVIPELSGKEVLTSELAVGARFDEVKTWSQEERNLTAETLFRFSFGSIYRLAIFNGDPHPGNYLFRPGGQITFLDFGLVKRFTEAETKLFEVLITAMVLDQDISHFRSIIVGAGLLPANSTVSDDLVREYFSFFYRYVMEDEVITIDDAYAAGGVRQLFEQKGPYAELKKELNVPPSFVLLQRITLGLMGLFADLEATANFRRLGEELWPFAEGKPSTPMGEEIAAFRRSQGADFWGL